MPEVKSYCKRVSPRAKTSMRNMVIEGIRKNREVGAVLCDVNGRIEVGPTCEGNQCNIPSYKFWAECPKGKRAGVFHTHGTEWAYPSIEDFRLAKRLKEPALVVGGKDLDANILIADVHYDLTKLTSPERDEFYDYVSHCVIDLSPKED